MSAWKVKPDVPSSIGRAHVYKTSPKLRGPRAIYTPPEDVREYDHGCWSPETGFGRVFNLWTWHKEEEIMARRDYLNGREDWLKDIAKTIWVVSGTKDMYICDEGEKGAREPAIAAYTRLKGLMGHMSIGPDMYVVPDYVPVHDSHTYAVFAALTIYGSDPMRIRDIRVRPDEMVLTFENFDMRIPVHLSTGDMSNLESYLRLLDPLHPLGRDEHVVKGDPHAEG